MIEDALREINESPGMEENGEWRIVQHKKAKTQVTASTPVTPLVTAKEKLKQRGEELVDTEDRLITPVKLEIYTKNKKR